MRKGRISSHRWLGMTINEKANIPDRVYRGLRATFYRAAASGLNARAVELGIQPDKYKAHLRGLLAYTKKQLAAPRYEKLHEWFELAQARDTLEIDLLNLTENVEV